jgi:hypothetical protein
MALEVQGKVGPVVVADGSLSDPRLGRDSPLIVGDAHGRFYENASRGLTFNATTAAAGIAPGTVLTATGALMLANPLGSGKNIAILKLFFAYVSGTFGAGTMWWAQGANPATLPAETAAALRTSTLANGSNTNDVAKAYSGVSLTTVPTIVRPTSINLAVYAGGATTLNPGQWEEVAGEIVIPPGFFVAVEGIAAAGTTPLVNLALTYEVVPQ